MRDRNPATVEKLKESINIGGNVGIVTATILQGIKSFLHEGRQG